MLLFQRINNLFNAAIGRNQALEQLIEAGDIERALSTYTSRAEMAEVAINEYNVESHNIMFREDKILKNAKGDRKGTLKRWKLPINYPEFINEVALVFLYGQPVKWRCTTSTETKNAFEAYLQLLKRTHFNSKLRECKRIAGAETQSAMLFRVFRDEQGKADCQIRVLARSKGDELYARWDIYENLTSVAWGYYAKDGESESSYHIEIYLPDVIYHCVRGKMGWDVKKEKNPIGKIPIILFEQNKEWKGVEPLIEREEYIGSRTADTNDYFSDPMLFVNVDVIKNMPEKDTENKTFFFKGDNSASNQAFYLTWDSAPESKQKEIEWLQKHILSKTFTPDIDFEKMKGLSNVSGKALKQMMLLADIKANKHKEKHDEYLTRTSSLCLAIIGNVLNVALKAECNKCVIEHNFSEPFGEDISEMLNNVIKAKDGDVLSQETAVELNPFVIDKDVEIQRLQKENEEAVQAQRDLFGSKQTSEDIYGN